MSVPTIFCAGHRHFALVQLQPRHLNPSVASLCSTQKMSISEDVSNPLWAPTFFSKMFHSKIFCQLDGESGKTENSRSGNDQHPGDTNFLLSPGRESEI